MIEYLKIGISFLTPLTIILIGIIINRKLEKSKIEYLKEKEWQILWADRFMNSAIELNTNISLLICTLFELQDVRNGSKGYNESELVKKLIICMHNIHINEWDIKNYTQFAEKNGQRVIEVLEEILDALRNIIRTRHGNIEPVRKKQFDFNKVVRNAHAEILNINTVHNK